MQMTKQQETDDLIARLERCRLSAYAKRMNVGGYTNQDRLGRIIRINGRGFPVVVWDGLKPSSRMTYHPDYIEIVREGEEPCNLPERTRTADDLRAALSPPHEEHAAAMETKE